MPHEFERLFFSSLKNLITFERHIWIVFKSAYTKEKQFHFKLTNIYMYIYLHFITKNSLFLQVIMRYIFKVRTTSLVVAVIYTIQIRRLKNDVNYFSCVIWKSCAWIAWWKKPINDDDSSFKFPLFLTNISHRIFGAFNYAVINPMWNRIL